MAPGGVGQAEDGVAMDADEASGLSDAVAFGQVVQDRDGLRLGEMAAVQRRPLAFGEACAAGFAVELSVLLVLAEAAANGEVAGVALAVEGTLGILAAKTGEVVHVGNEPGGLSRDAIGEWEWETLHILRRIPRNGSTC
jgi:hypothetical protein